MGGTVALGYTPDGRTLAIAPDEAIAVRRIFSRYLEIGSLARFMRRASRRGRHIKTFRHKKGSGRSVAIAYGPARSGIC